MKVNAAAALPRTTERDDSCDPPDPKVRTELPAGAPSRASAAAKRDSMPASGRRAPPVRTPGLRGLQEASHAYTLLVSIGCHGYVLGACASLLHELESGRRLRCLLGRDSATCDLKKVTAVFETPETLNL